MTTPPGLSAYITPEDRERYRQRAQERRWTFIIWFVVLVVGLILLALFVPTFRTQEEQNRN